MSKIVDTLRKPDNYLVCVPNRTINYSPWKVQEGDFRPDKIETLLPSAVLAPSTHNTQPWLFLKTGENSMLFLVDSRRVLPESDPTGREAHLSVGAAAANYMIAARHFGFNPIVEFIKEEQTGAFGQKITLEKGYTPTDEDHALFFAIPERINYDGEHRAGSLSQLAVEAISKTFTGQPEIEFRLIQDKPTKVKIGDLVREGDKEIFNNKKFIGELVSWMRDRSTRRKDGFFIGGIPRGLRRYAQKIILSLKQPDIEEMARNDRRKVRDSGAIGIIAADDDPRLWMQIGMLYQIAGLTATTQGLTFGARAVLVETGNLHTNLEETIGIQKHAQMMFRVGKPAETTLHHSPRIPYQERMAIEYKGQVIVPPLDSPYIFELESKKKLEKLIEQLGDVQVIETDYTEHELPDLFSVRHPDLPFPTLPYLDALEEFINENDRPESGVWIYNPHERTLTHHLNEDDFFEVITANNNPKISIDEQEKLRKMNIGVCGLSGSGAEAARAIAMSGVQNIALADFDFVSLRNKNRMEGTLGENKAWEFAWRMWKHNPHLKLQLYTDGIHDGNRDLFVQSRDLIVEQMDSAQKFKIRKAGKDKDAGAIIVQITDHPDPSVEIEMPGKPDFGGRAEAANITAEEMEEVTSAAQATGYLAVLMDPQKVPARSYENFSNIVDGESDGFAQLFIGAQAGGAALGRVLLAYAEGRLGELPRSYTVQTRPELPGDKEKQQEELNNFKKKYEEQFGDRLTDYF